MGLLRTPDLAALADAPFTYAHVGGTASTAMPEGYRHAVRSVVIGSGHAAFERAAAAVFDWRAQRGARLGVRSSGPPSVPGTVVVLTAGFPWLGYDIPCRVGWASATGDERGLAYRAVPGHPASGGERFVVRLTPGDDAG